MCDRKPAPQTPLRTHFKAPHNRVTLPMVSLNRYLYLFLVTDCNWEGSNQRKTNLICLSSHPTFQHLNVPAASGSLLRTLQRSHTKACLWVPAALLFGSNMRGSPLACNHHLPVFGDRDSLGSCSLLDIWFPKGQSLYHLRPSGLGIVPRCGALGFTTKPQGYTRLPVTFKYCCAATGSNSTPLLIALVCILDVPLILTAKVSKSALLEHIVLNTLDVSRGARARCQMGFVSCCLVSLSKAKDWDGVIVNFL